MGNGCCGCPSLADAAVGGNRVGSTDNAPASRLADNADSAVEIKAGLCNADPITKQGKRVQMAQMMCIPLVPIIILVVQACLSLAHSVASKVKLLASSCSSLFVFFAVMVTLNYMHRLKHNECSSCLSCNLVYT